MTDLHTLNCPGSSRHLASSLHDAFQTLRRQLIVETLAASGDPNIQHVVVTKSLNATVLYMQEKGIKKSREELAAMFNNIKNEIMGAPDSSEVEREARAKKILDAEFCTEYLNSVRSDEVSHL